MAKDNMLLGMARGKVGDLVFYRSGGVQITRARNRHPNNPRTFVQMSQRLMLANASKAAVGFREIVNHSFENVEYGAKSVRHFQSNAQKALKVAHPTTLGSLQVSPCVPLDAGGFPVAKFLISEGTLPSANVVFTRNAVNGTIIAAQSGKETEIDDITDVTVGDFFDLFGINFGDQITIVRTTAKPSVGGSGLGVSFNDNTIEPYIRLNFLPESEDMKMFDAAGEIIPDVLDLERSNNWGDIQAQIAVGLLSLTQLENCSGFALIVSRWENRKWRRSTETLTIAATEGTGTTADNLPAWGWNYYEDVVASLSKQINVAEDYFLNKEVNPTAGV